jgi:hypothetical protein
MSRTTVLNGFPDLLVRTEFGILDGEAMRLFVGDDWRRTITCGVPGEPTAGLPVPGVHGVSGAKSDGGDARMMADMVRTDLVVRPLVPGAPRSRGSPAMSACLPL